MWPVFKCAWPPPILPLTLARTFSLQAQWLALGNLLGLPYFLLEA